MSIDEVLLLIQSRVPVKFLEYIAEEVQVFAPWLSFWHLMEGTHVSAMVSGWEDWVLPMFSQPQWYWYWRKHCKKR